MLNSNDQRHTISYVTVGTYKLRDPEILKSVLDVGLESGYRMIGKLSSCGVK